MRSICFASNNEYKLKEIRLLLQPDFFILSLKDIGCTQELPETQSTFQGNALQKAEYVYKNFKVACFADDSGLEVDALNGEPGVYSARYAGPQRSDAANIELLLKNLSSASDRRARFKTVIALVGLRETRFFEGTVEGEIILSKRGTQGFGYDPIFKPVGYERTFAEMTTHEKNELSHRAKAIKKLAQYLKELSNP